MIKQAVKQQKKVSVYKNNSSPAEFVPDWQL
jgi:hypothetical protein